LLMLDLVALHSFVVAWVFCVLSSFVFVINYLILSTI
jgi:hypothetical protein